MGKSIADYRVGKEDLAPCPSCHEDHVTVAPGSQTIDPRCPLCSGTGIVGPKCVCGRPQVLTRYTYLAEGVHSCGRDECHKRLQKILGLVLEDAAPETKNTYHYEYTDRWGRVVQGYGYHFGPRWWERTDD